MKTAIICFSQRGLNLAEKLKTGLNKSGHRAEISVKSGYIKNRDVHCVTESLNDWTARQFREKDALCFIGACGIAVRAIAPFIKSKDTDPAVIAIDETGNFSVPLLSGHLGGANDLAEQAAFLTGAVPVITTSTDIHQVFAVDLFAKKNRLHIMDLGLAKEISASLLSGMPVGFHSDFPVSGNLPEGLVRGGRYKTRHLHFCEEEFSSFCENPEADSESPRFWSGMPKRHTGRSHQTGFFTGM